MLLGYNTNGLNQVPLEDALVILAQLGYRSVAITLDYGSLDPFCRETWQSQAPRIARWLQRLGLRCVVETGGRFLLDPRSKHRPTLLHPHPNQRQRRLEFLLRALTLAQRLGAELVSFWSGTAESQEPEEILWQRLITACQRLAESADRLGLRLGFEPEPGMFIDTMSRFAHLYSAVNHPAFGLTLDIGHLVCLGEPIEANLRSWRAVLWNVHLEDMRPGQHEHLPFGQGEVPVAAVLRCLAEVEYRGGVHIELSRHAGDGLTQARQAMDYLRPYWPVPLV
ncbi:MAG: sugar phosphate isomerase/epimerase family protein [Gemmatales bacterium]|nr:sugar phosphate isomerase/epimerase [Gemmatales bacterium]MDW7994946.1 sugar phosphate isomerase/epimerase family protein [Gemmatales bacterium]